MRNEYNSDIRRREQIIDIISGAVLVPVACVFVILGFCL